MFLWPFINLIWRNIQSSVLPILNLSCPWGIIDSLFKILIFNHEFNVQCSSPILGLPFILFICKSLMYISYHFKTWPLFYLFTNIEILVSHSRNNFSLKSKLGKIDTRLAQVSLSQLRSSLLSVHRLCIKRGAGLGSEKSSKCTCNSHYLFIGIFQCLCNSCVF